MSSDTGVGYLTGAVATGTHDYYTGAGEAAGVWSGGGLDRLGLEGEVSKEQMEALFVHALDWRTTTFKTNNRGGLSLAGSAPVVALGDRHPLATGDVMASKIDAEIAATGLTEPAQADAVAALVAAHTTHKVGVSGFDLQFAPSKSVSTMWALSTPDVRRVIEEAHDAAITAAFGHLEQHALFSRAGKGGVRQIDAEGFVVARYRHRTNREGHPQLHTHCAVLNRVWSVDTDGDGKWRTIDGRGLYRELHAAGTVYARAFEQDLAAALGVTFAATSDAKFREIDGVPTSLTKQWSRRDGIEAVYEQLAQDWFSTHGCWPTGAQIRHLWTQATLQTRKAKTGGEMDLHERWANEAGAAAVDTVRSLVDLEQARSTAPLVDEQQQDPTAVQATVDALQQSRSQFNRAQITVHAGAHLPPGVGPVGDRLEALVDAVLAHPEMVALGGDPFGPTPPAALQRASGESHYDPHGHRRWSTQTIMRAEGRLLDAANSHGAPTLEPVAVAWHVEQAEAETGRTYGADQRAAIDALTTGDRWLVTIIGPAGAGKTTLLRPVVDVYKAGGGEVIGLALSQNATNVLAADSGARCENIAKWLYQQELLDSGVALDDADRWTFRAGQLVIIDEAAMAPTNHLDRLVTLAHRAGARVAFVGDDMQLGSPEAGGLVRELAEQPGAVHLGTVRRFQAPWEAAASLSMRQGDVACVDEYDSHGRLIAVTGDNVIGVVVGTWFDRTAAGDDVVMIADTNAQASEMSRAARAMLIAAGTVERHGQELRDGNTAGVGDVIQTRRNDRQLSFGRGQFVSNRDTFLVVGITDEGGLQARHRETGDLVELPYDYVRDHVELAYAGTVASVQGRTVDGSLPIITPQTDRATLYVAMTRGRAYNIAHTITDGHDHDEFRTGTKTPAEAFAAALGRDTQQRSATGTLAHELATGNSLAVIAARRADVANQAATITLDAWLEHLAHDRTAPTIAPDRRGPLERTLAGLVGRHDLAAALSSAEPAARTAGTDVELLRVLRHHRDQLDVTAAAAAGSTPAWMPPVVEDLVEYTVALDDAMQARRRQIAASISITANVPDWARTIAGDTLDNDPTGRQAQLDIITVAAAYREQYAITDSTEALGAAPTNPHTAHHRDWIHTVMAISKLSPVIDRDRNGRDDRADAIDRDGNGRDDRADAIDRDGNGRDDRADAIDRDGNGVDDQIEARAAKTRVAISNTGDILTRIRNAQEPAVDNNELANDEAHRHAQEQDRRAALDAAQRDGGSSR